MSLLPRVKQPDEEPVVLSSALPPIGAKLGTKVQYLAMKELLSDSMAWHSQLTDLPLQTALAAHPHLLCEIESPCHGYSVF